MKFFNLMVSVVLVMLSSNSSYAAQMEDGLYFMTSSDKDPVVKALDGIDVHVGQRFTDPIEKAEFEPYNNDNAQFHFTLKKTGAFPKDNQGFILIVDGYCVRITGSGNWSDNVFGISGAVNSVEAATAFARYLKTEPRLRVHPKIFYTTKFIPSQKSFQSGEPLLVTLEIKNDGENPMTFQVGGQNRGERDNQFGFTASDGINMVPDSGSPVHFGGLSVNKTLKPGETFTKDIDLQKWFSFKKAGTYQMTGTYQLNFYDPADKGYFVIWQDYATANFYLKVDEKTEEKNIFKLTYTYLTENGKLVPYLTIGVNKFTTYSALKEWTLKLPEGTTLEFNPGCLRQGNEPLYKSEELDDFKKFCLQQKIILTIIPSG